MESGLSEKEYRRLAAFQIKNAQSYILQDDSSIYGIITMYPLLLSNIETYTQGAEHICCDASLFKKYESSINSIAIEEKIIKSFYSKHVCHIKIFLKEDISKINDYKSYGYLDLPTTDIPEYTAEDKSRFLLLYSIKNKNVPPV